MDRPCLPAIHFLLLPGVDPAIFLGDLLRHFLLDEHSRYSVLFQDTKKDAKELILSHPKAISISVIFREHLSQMLP